MKGGDKVDVFPCQGFLRPRQRHVAGPIYRAPFPVGVALLSRKESINDRTIPHSRQDHERLLLRIRRPPFNITSSTSIVTGSHRTTGLFSFRVKHTIVFTQSPVALAFSWRTTNVVRRLQWSIASVRSLSTIHKQ